jgi:hypothetical protein
MKERSFKDLVDECVCIAMVSSGILKSKSFSKSPGVQLNEVKRRLETSRHDLTVKRMEFVFLH